MCETRWLDIVDRSRSRLNFCLWNCQWDSFSIFFPHISVRSPRWLVECGCYVLLIANLFPIDNCFIVTSRASRYATPPGKLRTRTSNDSGVEKKYWIDNLLLSNFHTSRNRYWLRLLPFSMLQSIKYIEVDDYFFLLTITCGQRGNEISLVCKRKKIIERETRGEFAPCLVHYFYVTETVFFFC